MKKILLFLFLIPVFAAAQKTTGGNYTYIAQRYEWLTGIFQAFNLPAGDSARHKSGQDMRSGAVYLDTVNTQASPAGFYIYKNGVWELQAGEDICQNRLIDPITVTYTGTGMRFFVSGGRYQIGCNFYYLDSATITLGDGESNPRIDNIILTATGVDTLKGVEAASPVKPQVDADQIELTFVNIAAAATTPTIITHIIYDENTESVVTNTGTTTDPDNTSNVYRLTKSLNVTNINSGDEILFTLPSTINVQDFDALSGFLDLKATMSSLYSLRIRFMNGATNVSNEIAVGFNKQSTDWQGFSVPISSFTFNNTFVDKIRIRFIHSTSSSTVHSGFYLDYIHLAGGFTQPGGGGTSNPMTMGALDGKPANSKGATIENDVQYLQTATDSLPGLLSPILHEKLNNQRWEYFIRNLGSLGDSLAAPVNDSTVGIKKLVAGTNVTLTDTDTTIIINSTGGGTTPGIDDVLAVGQALTTNRTINTNTSGLTVSGSPASFGATLNLSNSSTEGQALSASSNGLNATIFSNNTKTTSGGGWAFYGQSVGSVPTGTLIRDSSSTNTVVPVLNLIRRTTGTAANGIGGSILFGTETGGSDFNSNEIASKWVDATQLTRTSELDIYGVNSGTTETYMNIQTGGIVRVNNNADTLATKAYARSVGGGGTPNLVVQRVGSGEQLHYVSGDSLYMEDIEGDGTYISVTPQADSTKRISLTAIPVSYVIAASDETTDITTGTAKVTFRMPHAMTVTAVRASVNTASSSGLPTIDINDGGTTILSTKITIDVSEKTSTTAATPPVISDSALADDAEITIDIDVSGTGAKGLKIIITGTRTI